MKQPTKLPLWRVTLVRSKGHPLGRVRARNAEEAIKRAIEEFSVTDPNRQRRLIAQAIEE